MQKLRRGVVLGSSQLRLEPPCGPSHNQANLDLSLDLNYVCSPNNSGGASEDPSKSLFKAMSNFFSQVKELGYKDDDPSFASLQQHALFLTVQDFNKELIKDA